MCTPKKENPPNPFCRTEGGDACGSRRRKAETTRVTADLVVDPSMRLARVVDVHEAKVKKMKRVQPSTGVQRPVTNLLHADRWAWQVEPYTEHDNTRDEEWST